MAIIRILAISREQCKILNDPMTFRGSKISSIPYFLSKSIQWFKREVVIDKQTGSLGYFRIYNIGQGNVKLINWLVDIVFF